MALDGILLSQLAQEVRTTALEARVDRIAQPYRDEIILHLRWRGGNGKLLLSASASNPRIHFTENIPENPQSPPMFCMLLRKYLSGARLINIRQQGLDRILYLDFEAMSELGDLVTLTLVQEIMGRHSNIILVNEDGMILDGIQRVGFDTSSVRQVLPNIRYHLPPGQDKLNLLEAPMEDILARIKAEGDFLTSRGVMNTLEGFSPLPSREVAYRSLEHDIPVSELTEGNWDTLTQQLVFFKELISQYKGTPTILLEEGGRLRDFTFFPVLQYGDSFQQETYRTYSEMLDAFYDKRQTVDRMRQISQDLHRAVKNTHDRIERRIAAQKEELLATKKREEWRMIGDILTANIYALKQGQEEAILDNFYSETGEQITIPLDIQKSPADNAQAYYQKYRKAATAEKVLTKQILRGKDELEYINSVADVLARATSASDLEALRSELTAEGYLKKTSRRKRQQPSRLKPHKYRSSDGFTILAGRNNVQNDQLSMRSSQRHDIWLHTQRIPGSHTIIVTENQEVPEQTLLQAATIAAYHSQAQDSTNVPVDYTEVRNVKKQSGAKPGMVIYDNFQTIFVTPDETLLKELEETK